MHEYDDSVRIRGHLLLAVYTWLQYSHVNVQHSDFRYIWTMDIRTSDLPLLFLLVRGSIE